MKINVTLKLTVGRVLMLHVYAFVNDQRILKVSFLLLNFLKNQNFLKKELVDFEIFNVQTLFEKKSLLLRLESHHFDDLNLKLTIKYGLLSFNLKLVLQVLKLLFINGCV